MSVDGEVVKHGSVVIAAITSCTKHVQPVGDARRGPPREEGGEAGSRPAHGSRPRWPRARAGHRLPRQRGPHAPTSRSCGSPSSGTAARRASGIRPLPERVSAAGREGDLTWSPSVRTGTSRGEDHPQVRASYLASLRSASLPLPARRPRSHERAARVGPTVPSSSETSGRRRRGRLVVARRSPRQSCASTPTSGMATEAVERSLPTPDGQV
jgi:hypothetical protein